MKRLSFIMGWLLSMLLLQGCHRQELEKVDLTKARIPVSVDWSVSGIRPQNVSMLFYHTDDGTLAFEHFFENNDNAVQSYVSVPVGSYTVVVFNELPGQIQNIVINGRNKLSTLQAYGIRETSVTMPVPGNIYWREPEKMACTIVHNFVVTEEMLYFANNGKAESRCEGGGSATNMQLMGLVPLEKICNFKLKVHIDNLNYARMPVLVNLQNMAGAYLFEREEDATFPVTYQFTLNDKVYDKDSRKSGTISGSTYVFGLPGSRMWISPEAQQHPISLDMKFMLVDAEKTVVTRSAEINSLIEIKQLNSGEILLEVDLSGLEPLPPVKPDGGDDSGFNSSVADWEVIDVPLESQ